MMHLTIGLGLCTVWFKVTYVCEYFFLSSRYSGQSCSICTVVCSPNPLDHGGLGDTWNPCICLLSRLCRDLSLSCLECASHSFLNIILFPVFITMLTSRAKHEIGMDVTTFPTAIVNRRKQWIPHVSEEPTTQSISLTKLSCEHSAFPTRC